MHDYGARRKLIRYLHDEWQDPTRRFIEGHRGHRRLDRTVWV